MISSATCLIGNLLVKFIYICLATKSNGVMTRFFTESALRVFLHAVACFKCFLLFFAKYTYYCTHIYPNKNIIKNYLKKNNFDSNWHRTQSVVIIASILNFIHTCIDCVINIVIVQSSQKTKSLKFQPDQTKFSLSYS